MLAKVIQLRQPPTQQDIDRETRFRKDYEFYQKCAEHYLKKWMDQREKNNAG